MTCTQQPDVRLYYIFYLLCFSEHYFFFKKKHLTLTFHALILDFQQHFKEISKNHSPVVRPFYVHLTSVIVRFISKVVNFFFHA